MRYNSSEHYVVKYFCLEFFWHEIPERSLIEVIEAFDSNQHAIHYKQRQNKYSRHDDVSALFTGQMLSIRSLLNVLANRKMTDDNYDKRHALKYATRQYFSHSFFFRIHVTNEVRFVISIRRHLDDTAVVKGNIRRIYV